ncbi:MAG: IclR family transcriptional regulator C-terminal domain-containing protein [Ornithinimicrobium sp.]|uniref:IclR family transcriptional regulator domain-containing protein n=1 Tax=Ornithinimicrobium sp. TaxID=1977084 RepID=UPI0026DFA063|nr:IclR family transcriptional regulator C-terminal domain-containing protein [Ornithinimicrobium sp.]MDO5739976.1 IclR family transcriptional regulator C-terminal domain-containing protein [Ornithinimicrobium sp.]
MTSVTARGDGATPPALPTPPAKGGGSGEFVQSLARGLDVITAFDAEHRELTLSEVAKRAGLTRATARRFLHTLLTLGYARQHDQRFALTPRVMRLGYAFLSGLPLADIAQPHLKGLSTHLGESTSVSVLDGPDILYIARVQTHRIMATAIPVGTRFPAYATSMGRVLLAHLPPPQLDSYLATTPLEPLTRHTLTDPQDLRAELTRVRAQGYAVADQQLALGLRSVALPLRDEGEVVAAINCSMPVHDGRTPHSPQTLVEALGGAAALIEEELAMIR